MTKELEVSLLAALSNKLYYEQYINLVDFKRLLPETKILLLDYERYFECFHSHAEIHFESFYTYFCQTLHRKDMDENDIQYYRDTVFPLIQNAEKQDVEAILIQLNDIKIKTQLEEAINKYDVSRCQELLDILRNQEQKEDVEAYTIDRVDFNAFDASQGTSWFLPSLSKSNGNIQKGQLIIVCAYSDVGKGAFCISQVAHTLRQKGKRVLYFTSEDTIQALYGRLFSALYNTRYCIIKETINKYQKQFKKDYGDRFVAFELNFGAMEKIENNIKKYQPDLVIIDMADTLCPGEESTLLIKKVYDTLRQYANKYCPIIATSQTRDTSYFDQEEGKMKNKKWLAMGDLYNSKVGKPGSATTIIGIAKDIDVENVRYIHTPKNKGFSKIKAVCELDDQTSTYKELG